MNSDSDKDVADSLEAEEALLPLIPELLQDLWCLGSSLNTIVGLIRDLKCPPETTRVLDLGCGKGAVSITLAKAFGFHVLGVDRFQPFLEEAIHRAEKNAVSHLCLFQNADLREALKRERDYDIVIFASVGGILGPMDKCAGALRQSVWSGGDIIIDDGFLSRKNRLDRPGYEYLSGHEETRKRLISHGDILVKEVLIPVEETNTVNRDYLKLIKPRAEELSKKYPEKSDLIRDYIQRQEEECDILEKEVSGAVWLIRKM